MKGILSQVESEIVAFERSAFANSLSSAPSSPPSSDSSGSDDSADEFAGFVERPISPPMTTFGGSDSYVEDYHHVSRSSLIRGRTSGQPYQRQDLTATRELKNGDETPTAPKTYFTEDDWAALTGRVKKVESEKQRVSKSRIEPSVKMASNQDKTTILLADIAGDWLQRMHQ